MKSSFTRHHVAPNHQDFLSYVQNTKEDSLKNAGNQTVGVAIEFHYMDRKVEQIIFRTSELSLTEFSCLDELSL